MALCFDISGSKARVRPHNRQTCARHIQRKMPSIVDIPHETLEKLCCFLDTVDAVRLGRSCKTLASFVRDNQTVWQDACARDWHVTWPMKEWGQQYDPIAHPFLHPAAIWRRCLKHVGGDTASLIAFRHTMAVFARLEAFLENSFPVALCSLQLGVPQEMIEEVEKQLGVSFPASLRAMYTFIDGQQISPVGGLLGGVVYYGTVRMLYLVVLHNVVKITAQMRIHPRIQLHSRFVVFARSFDVPFFLLLDTEDGLVYTLSGDGRILPAMPPTSGPQAGNHYAFSDAPDGVSFPPPLPGQRDEYGLLRYLSEYVSRLESGIYRMQELPSDMQAAVNEDEEVKESMLQTLADGVSTAGIFELWRDDYSNAVDMLDPSQALDENDEEIAAVNLIRMGLSQRVRRLADAGALTSDFRYICTWPEAGPGTSYAQTGNVAVFVSSAFLPHQSALGGAGLTASAPRPTAAAAVSSTSASGSGGDVVGGVGAAAAEASSSSSSSSSSGEGPASKRARSSAPIPSSSSTGAAGDDDDEKEEEEGEGLPGTFGFTYRVRMWMLPEGHGDVSGSSGSDVPMADANDSKSSTTRSSGGTRVGGGVRYDSAQLRGRYWRIVEPSGHEEVVEGEGVIGLHPLLRPMQPLREGGQVVATTDEEEYKRAYAEATAATAKSLAPHSSSSNNSASAAATGSAAGTDAEDAALPAYVINGLPFPLPGLDEGGAAPAAAAGYRNAPFEYASQTTVSARGTSFVGHMGGHFVMVPGSLAHPTGQPFNATVAPWELRVPDFIF